MTEAERLCTFAFFLAMLLCFGYLFHGMIVKTDSKTTIRHHIFFAKLLAEKIGQSTTPGGVKALGDKQRDRILMRVPHRGYFHGLIALHRFTGCSYEECAILLLSIFATLTACTIFEILRRSLPDWSVYGLIAATAVLMTTSAIYIPFFNKAVYFGQGSPNTWHNSTLIMVKPLALISFYMAMNILTNERIQRLPAYSVLTALVIALSVYIKPTFIIVFLPALAIYMPLKCRLQWPIYLRMLLIFAPSLLVLGYQYSVMYAIGSPRKIELMWLAIWRLFTPNVFVSVLITIAFPLSVLLVNPRAALKDKFFSMSWIVTMIGMLQFAALAEVRVDGRLVRSGNWIGGYLIALGILFITSTVLYLRWIRDTESLSVSQRLILFIATMLLALHTFSGGYYIYELLTYQDTTLIWYVHK